LLKYIGGKESMQYVNIVASVVRCLGLIVQQIRGEGASFRVHLYKMKP